MKRKGTNSDSEDDHQRDTKKAKEGADICDDVLVNIFSRLPIRTAVRCAALSRRHRHLIGDNLDFWLLRSRHGPPLPRPHIAYMTNAPILPGCLFHEFHLAGGEHRPGGNNGLRRALIDRVPPYSSSYNKYVGTCNGVVLLAQESFSGDTSVVLFNPAVAGGEEVVDINLPRLDREPGRYRVSGFGYSPSGKRHKLLVAREERNLHDQRNCKYSYNAKELFVYTLDRTGPDHRRGAPVKSGLDTKISGKSVYLDGKVYLLADYSRVLAFDADDETITTIELPGERVAVQGQKERHAKSKLMEMSGRLCVATAAGQGKLALWLLTADQQWERRCEFWILEGYRKLAGAWDCGGVALLLTLSFSKEPGLHLYDTRTNANHWTPKPLDVPRAVVNPEHERSRRRVFCWGYQPTLVSPGSIAGAPPRQRGGGVLAALNPVLERDVNAGKERTLRTVCFMDMLIYIMRQLPDREKDVTREFNPRALPFSLR